MPEQNKPVGQDAARTIDITPTWGEWGNMYARFAESGERRAVKHLHKDFARAMAACQSLSDIAGTLTTEQKAIVDATRTRELAKQGITEQSNG